MSDYQQHASSKHTIIYDGKVFDNADENIFESHYWQQAGAITGTAKGRGTTYFIHHNQRDIVLRHYLRGGLIGKVLREQYLYTGLVKTRAWQEFHLLKAMRAEGLLVPDPIGARVTRHGLYYTADILISKIPNATDGYELLLNRPLVKQNWHDIGQSIAKLHHHQVYHHDLNIHNILIDQAQQIWLIDFDKCRIQKGERWKQQNLQRLKRSLTKEKQRNSQFNWLPSDWNYLISGYTATN